MVFHTHFPQTLGRSMVGQLKPDGAFKLFKLNLKDILKSRVKFGIINNMKANNIQSQNTTHKFFLYSLNQLLYTDFMLYTFTH